MDLTSLLTVPGIATAVTILVGAFNLKQKLSSLAVNLLTILLGVILSAVAYFVLGKFVDINSYIIMAVNGLLGGLSSAGIYEGYKHITGQ